MRFALAIGAMSMVLSTGCAGVSGDGRWVSDTDADWGYVTEGGVEFATLPAGKETSQEMEFCLNQTMTVQVLLMTDSAYNTSRITSRDGDIFLALHGPNGTNEKRVGGPLREWYQVVPSRVHFVDGAMRAQLPVRAFGPPGGTPIEVSLKANYPYRITVEGSALLENPRGGADGMRVILMGRPRRYTMW